jgi:hypothetical protein
VPIGDLVQAVDCFGAPHGSAKSILGRLLLDDPVGALPLGPPGP